ncbi:SDR family NAD(P)-dependent oxidoreductase [Pseudomonas putida]|uniref:SDR family NAD(P)-dependent oxidoreductase n=1 Tax=Pseudomonas putida TaxID=303 RepID=UPI001576BEC1|nr:SDR family NAD(P)-dependent oxidoreductase [Pseudomonas putida]NTY92249.1 SDR family oxidoreductase [Pseudomonas putida]NTY99425.1 SDR family oxidoreductase [Pseudomonas putida]NTZ24191.1 SDR family oxidoreductase [Pseudomonas putida]NTZ54692.1 SDR family oxidoreductase [Pseudomonas putida]NTZ66307.1 SDR family oxidoreductase [Pseudomonas putida]
MKLELEGKVALVTGSSAGIGLAIAQQLAEEGCHIVLNGRDPARLQAALAMMEGASAIAADVRDPDACQALVAEVLARHGRLDILVCNVGSGASVPPGQENPAEWRRVLDTNLHATTQTVWAAQDALLASRGCVICISSICGVEALGCPVPYAAAKAAVESYVRNAARWMGRHGVRINSIAPGNILFDGSVWERKLREDRSAVESMLARDVALGSLGCPADIARLAAYLASPVAGFITGSTYVVDGGQLRS